MKKINKFLIVCIILIGLGIALWATGFALGGRVYGFGLNQNGFQVYAPQLYGKNNNGYIKEDVTLDAFNKIDVDVRFSSIKFVPGDHYGISYQAKEQSGFTYEISDGTLKVKDNYDEHYFMNADFQWFSFGSAGSIYDSYEEYVEIYVPTDVSLDTVSLSSDHGDFTITGVNAADITLKSSYADILFSDSTVSSITMDSKHGSMKLSEVTGDSLSITNVYGDVYGDALSCDDIKLSTKNGSCEFKGLAINTAELAATYGDIDLELAAPYTDYGYEIQTKYGDISLDNEYTEDDSLFIPATDASKQIILETKHGNISVK